MASQGNFYHTFKEEIIRALYKVFQKLEKEGILLNSFYEDGPTLILKPDKDIKTEMYTTIPHEHS